MHYAKLLSLGTLCAPLLLCGCGDDAQLVSGDTDTDGDEGTGAASTTGDPEPNSASATADLPGSGSASTSGSGSESGGSDSTGDDTTGGDSTGEAESSSGGPPPAVCGNALLEDGEACDDGDDNSDTLPDACRTTCELPTCGDDVLDSGEDCDVTAPGCLADCSFDAPDFGPFPAATVVLGQLDENSGISNAFEFAFRFPGGVFTHEGRVYASNGQASGIYVFDALPTEAGVLPDHVLGRESVGGAAIPFGPNSLSSFSRGLSSDGSRFAIADRTRGVLLYDEAPVDSSDPDIVVGQPDFETSEHALTADRFLGEVRDVSIGGGRMVVSDFGGNRVLVWNTIPTENDTPADLVLGQATFEEGEANRGGEANAGTFDGPFGVWTDGTRVAVVDHHNHRVLLWDTFPTENGQAADHVIGQDDGTSTELGTGATRLRRPIDVLFAGNRMYISDQLNHRVLFFEGWPEADGAAADGVIGQSNFDSNAQNDDDQDGSTDATPSARTFARPSMLHLDDGRLYVSDAFNHRFVVFEGQ